jgi:hypothetical protein
MSGLPALRCFIFFAADLFILVLPSFDRETLAEVGQGFVHIAALKSVSTVGQSGTTGILTDCGMVAKRTCAMEASRYRRRQPLSTASAQGVLSKPRTYTFGKIFPKPQPPRVQSSQILGSILTV